MERKNKFDLGFIIDPEGNIYDIPTFYDYHFLNYDMMLRELGFHYTNKELLKRNEIGYREFSLYKLANEGFICIINLGYEDNNYLGIYLNENCNLTEEQKNIIKSKYDYINNYKHHEINFVPKIEEMPSLKEVGVINLNINNEHNAIFDIINTKTKVKNRR